MTRCGRLPRSTATADLIKGQVFLWKDGQTWEDLWDVQRGDNAARRDCRRAAAMNASIRSNRRAKR